MINEMLNLMLSTHSISKKIDDKEQNIYKKTKNIAAVVVECLRELFMLPV